MGIVLNLRGTAGSGKTEFVRRVLALYGWPSAGRVEPLHEPGRCRPIAYRLAHPQGRRPLVVLGAYERTRGGCDTIGVKDGGLPGVFRRVEAFCAQGHDVLLEGLALSCESPLSEAFACRHGLHVLHLATPVERSVANLAARRHAGPRARALLLRKVAAEHAAIAAACARLAPVAAVETLPFDAALSRVRGLLGLDPRMAST